MLSRIGWRQRALAWSALPVGAALLLAVACAPAPLPLAAHAALTVAAPDALVPADHAAMSMADHAAMLAASAQSAPARVAPPDGRPADTMADAPVIDIQAFKYSAEAVTVPVGTTVTWTNHDVEPHTVTSKDRVFASAGLETNDTFTFRFDTPGTYAYFCALHPFMTGQIVVQ